MLGTKIVYVNNFLINCEQKCNELIAIIGVLFSEKKLQNIQFLETI